MSVRRSCLSRLNPVVQLYDTTEQLGPPADRAVGGYHHLGFHAGIPWLAHGSLTPHGRSVSDGMFPTTNGSMKNPGTTQLSGTRQKRLSFGAAPTCGRHQREREGEREPWTSCPPALAHCQSLCNPEGVTDRAISQYHLDGSPLTSMAADFQSLVEDLN